MKLEQLTGLVADKRLKVKHGHDHTIARFVRFGRKRNQGVFLIVQKYDMRNNTFGNDVTISPDDVMQVYG